MPSNIPLTPGARAHALNLTNDFDYKLKSIAGLIAEDAGADEVVVPHIAEAYTTLRRCGLRSPGKLLWRSDVWIAVGGILVGISPSISSLAFGFIPAGEPSPVAFGLFVCVIPIVAAVAGTSLLAAGVVRLHR